MRVSIDDDLLIDARFALSERIWRCVALERSGWLVS